ncbi:MAG: hypothetical protein HWN65_17880 [Candidatus Helarchaeota archaeon]|nr:hypothetical protein [Candidatus Helarchaeota archaeon]
MSELKLRPRGEVLREIPDSYYAKRFIPLAENLFTSIRLMDDWKIYLNRLENLQDTMATGLRDQLDESIKTFDFDAQERKKITRMKETVVRWGYPPILPIRMDMANLSTKMIYGPSVDISFVSLSDKDRDMVFIYNLHMEESRPTDYWFLIKSEEPELFNRRHMKLGIRLGDVGKKIKDNIEVGRRIREILTDIRNEKTPQWKNSAYYVSVYFMVGASNVSLELSNWNAIGGVWDGVNATNYGLENCMFNYEPLPPILNIMFELDRPTWIDRISRATMENLLYLNYTMGDVIEELKKTDYEAFDYYMRFLSYQLEKGIPLPSQTLQCKRPIYNKETGQWERYGFEFPKGPRIHYRDLGLTFKEALGGILFDITHESQVEKVTRDNIISLGHGFETKYLRPDPNEEN